MNRLGLTAAIGIAGAAAVAVWAGGKEDSPPGARRARRARGCRDDRAWRGALC